MKRKLRSSSGFTLLESLVAIAILALMLTALGAGTAASVRVYKQSTALSEANILSSTLFEAISDELRFAADITTASGQPVFTSPNHGANVSISSDGGRVKIFRSGLPVGDLIGEKAYTSLNAAIETLSYSSDVFAVAIVITDPSQDSAVCSRAEFYIAPLNP